jgi:hypothetical protein
MRKYLEASLGSSRLPAAHVTIVRTRRATALSRVALSIGLSVSSLSYRRSRKKLTSSPTIRPATSDSTRTIGR